MISRKKSILRVSCIAGSPLGRGRRRSRRPSPPSCDRPVYSNFKFNDLNKLVRKQSHVAGGPGPAAPVALPGGRVEGSGGRANYRLVVRPMKRNSKVFSISKLVFFISFTWPPSGCLRGLVPLLLLRGSRRSRQSRIPPGGGQRSLAKYKKQILY